MLLLSLARHCCCTWLFDVNIQQAPPCVGCSCASAALVASHPSSFQGLTQSSCVAAAWKEGPMGSGHMAAATALMLLKGLPLTSVALLSVVSRSGIADSGILLTFSARKGCSCTAARGPQQRGLRCAATLPARDRQRRSGLSFCTVAIDPEALLCRCGDLVIRLCPVTAQMAEGLQPSATYSYETHVQLLSILSGSA